MDLPLVLMEERTAQRVVSVDGAWEQPGLNLSHWPGNTIQPTREVFASFEKSIPLLGVFLRVLVALRAKGLRQPLPFAPRSAWLYYSAATPERGIEAARKQWQGGERQWAEGGEPAWALALRARDPFADRGALREFVGNAIAVFDAVAAGTSSQTQPDGAALAAALAAAPLAGDEDE